ncbi:MFS transporter [Bacillus sp. 1P06AnD]|uniref:MFS transporter n=1 Tax=Bacillus sp. 1P06AnD TaxID=3132208 RepID=UPI0039A0902E
MQRGDGKMMKAWCLFREEKQYRQLFLAGVINGLGDRFSQVAMLGLLLRMTGSGFAVGTALAIRVIPFLLFGPLGGYITRRFSKKKVMIGTDIIRIGFALSFLFVHSESDLWIVYVSSFVLGAGEAIYAPARKSLLPSIVQEKNIMQINGLEQSVTGIVLIAGSFSGGVVAHYLGEELPFVINGISFIAAAVILFFLKESHLVDRVENHKQNGKVAAFPIIRTMIAASGILSIIFMLECIIPIFDGANNVLISVYAVEVFRMGDIGVGLFYAALGIGLISSFSLANRISGYYLEIGMGMLMLEGILIIALSRMEIAWLGLIVYFFISFASGIGNAAIDTLLMKETKAEYHGIVFGLLSTVSNVMMGLSMFGTGIVLAYVSARNVGLIAGGGFLITAMALYAIYKRKKAIHS